MPKLPKPMDWNLISSDPAVFSQMIRELGAKDVDVEELYSLDDNACDVIRHDARKVYGFILLFKFDSNQQQRTIVDVPGVFFAKQVVTNACASQAFLSVLLNAQGIDLGPFLTNFKSFTLACDPETRGICIGNSDEIRKVHNSFTSQSAVSFEGPGRELQG